MPRKLKKKVKWKKLETPIGYVFTNVSNVKNLKKRLKENNIKVTEEDEIKSFDLDLPGPILQDRLWQDIKFYNLTIRIPLHNLYDIITELKLSRVQYFNNKDPYYSFEGYFNFVVLNAEERLVLIECLETLPSNIKSLATLELERLNTALESVSMLDTKDTLPN